MGLGRDIKHLLIDTIALVSFYLTTGADWCPFLQKLYKVKLNGYRFAGNVGSVLAFCIGASLYYLIFYQTKLVPRWLSVWGLLGTALLMVAILMVMFQIIEPLSTPQVLLALPIAVQEMVL